MWCISVLRSDARGVVANVVEVGPGQGLSPLDVVKFTAAYAKFIALNTPVKNRTIVVGRDARLSGAMVDKLVTGTLMGMGFDVINIGLASTPTTEIAVTAEGACGGIIRAESGFDYYVYLAVDGEVAERQLYARTPLV